MDIVIYTNPEVLAHKKGEEDTRYHEYYWKFSRFPKKIDGGGRVYFATKGFIRGFFRYGSTPRLKRISWSKNSWRDIRPIPCKPFRGFRYKWWEDAKERRKNIN